MDGWVVAWMAGCVLDSLVDGRMGLQKGDCVGGRWMG